MIKGVFLKDWSYEAFNVKLVYSDNSVYYMTRELFNRSFGTIISITKDELIRDFVVCI